MIINYIFFHNLGVYIHITVDNYIFFFLYTHIMWIFVEPCRFMIRVYLDTLIHPPQLKVPISATGNMHVN